MPFPTPDTVRPSAASRRYRSAIACLAWLGAGPAPAEITVEPLFTTGEDALGAPLSYPDSGAAEISGAIVTLMPGDSTDWHSHAIPVVGYVLSGRLEVEYATGEQRVFETGEGLVESQHVAHNGHNNGAEPVRLVVFYAGAPGLDRSTPENPPAGDRRDR